MYDFEINGRTEGYDYTREMCIEEQGRRQHKGAQRMLAERK